MSVTTPAGFLAGATAAGIKGAGRPDMALVASSTGAVPAAAVFTQNRAAAAPVLVSRAHLEATGGKAAAVLLTSGNANAATGATGLHDAKELAGLAARGIGVHPEEVLICQTGLIGIPMPMSPARAGVGRVVADLAGDDAAADRAARAIMTTDTVPKTALVEGDGFSVGAIAKGAAMLAPNMATMLAVLTTDAAVEPGPLRAALVAAVDRTFNRLSIDGCTSTNDTVVVLASGARRRPVDAGRLERALEAVCRSLAEQMAADAEGATKVALVRVEEAADDDQAHRAARSVAESQLVQCSLNGADPYWGRVVSELGAAGVDFELDRVTVAYGGVVVCAGGHGVTHDERAVAAHMAGRRVEITCRLGMGRGAAAVLTTDLGHGYIDENRTTS